jgi:adenosylcobyric acid synthase
MRTPSVMYLGVGANAGKTVFTRAHCRLLSDRGLAVGPFKPVAVTRRQETRDRLTLDFRLWALGAAARSPVDHDNGPVQVLRIGPDHGALRINGADAGTVPLMATDTPLFDPHIVVPVLAAIRTAHASLAARCEVLLVEGSGSCVDLAPATDPANTATVALVRPAVVLVAGAQAGGAVAGLRGTWSELPPAVRERVAGFALNDVSGGTAILERGAGRVAAEAGVPFLGSLPHTTAYDDPPPGRVSRFADPEDEYDHLARHFAGHLDVEAIHRAAGLPTATPAGPAAGRR